MAIGAAVENAHVAAAALGYDLAVSIRPRATGSPLAVDLEPFRNNAVNAKEAKARLDLVRMRVTNRKYGDGSELGKIPSAALIRAATAADLHLQLVACPARRREIGFILGAFDRMQFTVPALHRDMIAELRWTAEEAERSRDGIELAALELEPKEVAALWLLARPEVAAILREPGRGGALEERARKASAACSAIGLLRVRTDTATGLFEAGRVMQRIWLEAVRLGLSLQPWTAFTFISRIVAGECDTFAIDRSTVNDREKSRICSLSDRLDRVFAERCHWPKAMLFLVSRAQPPSSRSRRHDIEEIFRRSRKSA
jgi:hypothetical protein